MTPLRQAIEDGGIRALVCGSRDWADDAIIHALLVGVYSEAASNDVQFAVIDGGAPGADSAACSWAKDSEKHSRNENPDDLPFEHLHFDAEWERYRPADPRRKNPAGPIRNRKMLREGAPNIVFVFSDELNASSGSADMVDVAIKADVPVYHVRRVLTSPRA